MESHRNSPVVPGSEYLYLFYIIELFPCSFLGIWQPPTLPHRLQCSTIGLPGLNRRVRDGNGCVPRAHRRQKSFVITRAAFPSLDFALLHLGRVKALMNLSASRNFREQAPGFSCGDIFALAL